jgi:hypothetical protein
MKFRKKPVVVEVHLFTGDILSAEKWAWRLQNKDPSTNLEWSPIKGELVISTLEGNMRVPKGNYIICGVRGELYSCEPNIFHQTYEEVT